MEGAQHGWSTPLGWLLGLVVALCIVAGLAVPARAAPSVYAVNSTADAADANRGDGRCADAGGNCTLRAAVQEANTHPNDPTGPDEITIPSGTYTLTIAGPSEDAAVTGDLDITDNVNITGAGKASTSINGNDLDRVFHNVSKNVTISGLEVTNGKAQSGGAFYNTGPTANATFDGVRFTANEAIGEGGAIFNEATARGIDSEFTNNKTLGSFGGAISQQSGAAILSFTRTSFEGNTAPSNGGAINMNGTLVLKGASFRGNTTTNGFGGGILIFGGHATIGDTTFAGNSAGGNGGGGGLYLNENTVNKPSTITNSTFSGNKAALGGGIYSLGQGTILTHVTIANNTGGGVQSSGSLTSKSSIFAYNGPQDCSGSVISQGRNLSSDATCFAPGGTDRTRTDPKLGELADNGGPTKTLALLDGSPAIDAADNTNATAFDQRGVSRPQDGDGDGQALHDIGAFEKEARDTEAPQLTVPSSPVVVEATDANGATVNFANDVSASDAVDPNPTIACSPASGSVFPLGTTMVECSASDNSGNSRSGSFEVTVVDTTAPQLNMPENKNVEATGANGAAVTFARTANDIVDGPVTVDCFVGNNTVRSGETFPLGTTRVDCSATDAAGNRASDGFTVRVQDTTAPTLHLPANVTEEASGPDGKAVDFAATANDIVDGGVAVTCSPASGSTFPLGTTTVDCSAADAAGNHASGSFTVKVQDTSAPVIAPHGDVSVTAVGNAGSTVTYTAPSTSDAVDGPGTATCTPASGSQFAIGSTTVTCAAKDAAGNEASPTTFKVNVGSYSWSGFLQPINTPANMASYSQSVFKMGSTVPVKFSLTGANAGITDGNFYLKYIRMGNGDGLGEVEVVATATGHTGTQFRYDATTGQYVFNWSTKGITQAGNYEVRVYTDSTYTNLLGSQSIELKK